MRTFIVNFWIVLLYCLMSDTFSQTSSEEIELARNRIYKMKAVFIFNFIKYITWPERCETDSFTIVVLGKSEITPFLNQIAQKKMIKGKKIVIHQFDKPYSLPPSDILFVDGTAVVDIIKLRKKYGMNCQLIIGDRVGLARRGAGISFYIENGRVKFELNRKSIELAHLYVSSQLLKLAKIIE